LLEADRQVLVGQHARDYVGHFMSKSLAGNFGRFEAQALYRYAYLLALRYGVRQDAWVNLGYRVSPRVIGLCRIYRKGQITHRLRAQQFAHRRVYIVYETGVPV